MRQLCYHFIEIYESNHGKLNCEDVSDDLPNTGSLLHPLRRTPRAVGSMRKCLTSSLLRSPPLEDAFTLGGGVATLTAKPNAPGKEFESRTMKVPGGLLFKMLIAERKYLFQI